MSSIERNNWIFGNTRDVFVDKDAMIQHYIMNMLNRTARMFEYENLPDTMPQKDIEFIFQVGGFGIATVVDGKPYIFRGGLGGKPNPYYLPTIATVANPALNFEKNLTIDEECVVILNDNGYQGILPLLSKYATMLVEAEISLKHAVVNARVPAIMSADNDGAYESAVKMIDDVVNGNKYGVISSQAFFEGIKTQDFFKYTHIKDIIEAIQYIKGSAFNEIGLNAAFNMKREAINEAEATLNEDILYPLIDTMLECRQIGFDKFNKMFGFDVRVKLGNVWANNKRADDIATQKQKAEVEQIQAETEAELADTTAGEEEPVDEG